MMYAGNIDEFWFDLGILMSVMIVPFLVCFASLSVFYVLIFSLTKRKTNVFWFIEIISFVGFIYLYIHGNFLTSMLPTLYGDTINWWSGDLIIGHILSLVLLLAIIIVIVFGIKRFSAAQTAKYSFFATVIFATMMMVSFVTTLATPGLFVDKEVQSIATTKNIRQISTEKNFYILLVDCTDSEAFNEYVKLKYQDNFNDFTYYKDSAPGYSLTRDSIPLIFSGLYNRNELQFNAFSTDAFDHSSILNFLNDDGYSVNLYSDDVVWNSKKSANISNFNNNISNYSKKSFLKQGIKYVLYKYLPFALKTFSNIESMDFMLAIRNEESDGVINWKNTYYNDNVLSQAPEETTEKLFQFVHIEGSHSPYDMDEELNLISDGTYHQKVGAAAKVANSAIERFKKAGVYDDSVIVIMSDHGWFTRDAVLYVKGFNEKHKSMKVSDKQVSWANLDEAFTNLAKGATSEDAFKQISNFGEKRYYYVNPYYNKEPMVEYVLDEDGRSYNKDDWKKTGVEYPFPVR